VREGERSEKQMRQDILRRVRYCCNKQGDRKRRLRFIHVVECHVAECRTGAVMQCS
jgi:hypothetical protein